MRNDDARSFVMVLDHYALEMMLGKGRWRKRDNSSLFSHRLWLSPCFKKAKGNDNELNASGTLQATEQSMMCNDIYETDLPKFRTSRLTERVLKSLMLFLCFSFFLFFQQKPRAGNTNHSRHDQVPGFRVEPRILHTYSFTELKYLVYLCSHRII